eukprot:4668643-Amphidinium_carterae.1
MKTVPTTAPCCTVAVLACFVPSFDVAVSERLHCIRAQGTFAGRCRKILPAACKRFSGDDWCLVASARRESV